MKNPSLYALVQQFLLVYLRSTKGLSENTICSYRDTLKIFFIFSAGNKKRSVSNLTLDDFDIDIVLKFLNHIESARGNKARTRNHRLALLRAFFSYLLIMDAERGAKYEKILKIPLKQTPRVTMGYLEVNEISGILKAIDQTTKKGRRDYMLLMLMYNTGARVQEICDLKIKDLDLDGNPTVTLTGKGSKIRIVPLWNRTKEDLNNYLSFATQREPNQSLFCNQYNEPLTRHGVLDIVRRRVAKASAVCPSIKKKKISPHTLRHTTAMHLLQSGVDLTVIRTWLGHVSINTTHQYIDIDLKMKQEALSKKKSPQIRRELSRVLEKNKDIVKWLTQMK